MTYSGSDDGRWMRAEEVEDASKADGGRVRGQLRRRRAVELKSRASTVGESTAGSQAAVADAKCELSAQATADTEREWGPERDTFVGSGYHKGTVSRRGAISLDLDGQFRNAEPAHEAGEEALDAPEHEWTAPTEWYAEEMTYDDSLTRTGFVETIDGSSASNSIAGCDLREVGSDCETSTGNAQDACLAPETFAGSDYHSGDVTRRGAMCMDSLNEPCGNTFPVNKAEVETRDAPKHELTEETPCNDSLKKSGFVELIACSIASDSTAGCESRAISDCDTSTDNAQESCELDNDSCPGRVEKKVEEEESEAQKMSRRLFSELQDAMLGYHLRRAGGAKLFQTRVARFEKPEGNGEEEEERQSLLRVHEDLGHLVKDKDFAGVNTATDCQRHEMMR